MFRVGIVNRFYLFFSLFNEYFTVTVSMHCDLENRYSIMFHILFKLVKLTCCLLLAFQIFHWWRIFCSNCISFRKWFVSLMFYQISIAFCRTILWKCNEKSGIITKTFVWEWISLKLSLIQLMKFLKVFNSRVF